MSTQETYRHGWLIDCLFNNIPGRETLLQEREIKLGGSVHGHKSSFWLVTSKLKEGEGVNGDYIQLLEQSVLCVLDYLSSFYSLLIGKCQTVQVLYWMNILLQYKMTIQYWIKL